MNEMVSKWVALVVILTSLLLANTAMGADYNPCYEAYLESGLSVQQMSFDHFRHSYADTLCAREGEVSGATAQQQILRENR